MLSEIEYPHWMMVAGVWLVVVGFIGLWISRNGNLEPAEDNLLPAASPNFSVAGRAEGEAMSIVTDLLDDRGRCEDAGAEAADALAKAFGINLVSGA